MLDALRELSTDRHGKVTIPVKSGYAEEQCRRVGAGLQRDQRYSKSVATERGCLVEELDPGPGGGETNR